MAPNPPSRKDLDDWLESCLKDAAGPQLSSSSEFLDYNASSFSTNKKSSSQNFNSNNGRSKLPQNSINYYFQKVSMFHTMKVIGIKSDFHFSVTSCTRTSFVSSSFHQFQQDAITLASSTKRPEFGIC